MDDSTHLSAAIDGGYIDAFFLAIATQLDFRGSGEGDFSQRHRDTHDRSQFEDRFQ